MFLALNKTSPADLAASRPDAATIEGSLDDMVLREASEAKDIGLLQWPSFPRQVKGFLVGPFVPQPPRLLDLAKAAARGVVACCGCGGGWNRRAAEVGVLADKEVAGLMDSWEDKVLPPQSQQMNAWQEQEPRHGRSPL